MRRLLILSLFLSLFISTPVWATKYWVSTTGSNANPCASIDGDTDPGVYKASAAGVFSAGCAVAGDTIHMNAGTYSAANSSIYEPDISVPDGTAGAYTTIEGEGAAVTILQAGGNVLQTPRYARFQNFTWNGTPSYVLGNIDACLLFGSQGGVGHHIEILNMEFTRCHHGVQGYADDVTIRNTHVHHFGGKSPNPSPGGEGFYMVGARALIEDSEFDNAGHDCSTCNAGNQIWEASGVPGSADGFIVRRNKFHDNNFGVALRGNNGQFYDNESYNNRTGGILVFRSTILVHNNISYNNTSSNISLTGSAVGVVMKNNIFFGGAKAVEEISGIGTHLMTYNACETARSCGTTGKVNLTAITDITVSTTDFHHKPGSIGINAGTTVSTRSCNGVCDLGPYETAGTGALGFSTATITAATMDVTLAMNLNVPLLPASGITGFTVGCSGGVNCGTPVVDTGTRLTGSDSIVRLTITGFGGAGVCEVGQTITVAYTPGNVTDSVGQALASFTSQAVSNACGPAAPAEPGTPHIKYNLDQNTGTQATDSTANLLHGTLTNGPTWEAPGKHGASAVHFVDGGDDFIAVPYGNTINPTTQSLTICMGVKPDVGLESSSRIFFGSPNGSNQRLYLGFTGGFWAMGIKDSSFSTGGNNTEFPVTAGYTRICILVDKDTPGGGTGTAKLAKNGTIGSSAQSVKTYTSYALAGNFAIGTGVSQGGSYMSGSTVDDFVLYTSLLTPTQIMDDKNAWEPPSPPANCTISQVGNQAHLLRQTSGGLVENYRALNAATVNVVAGGALMLTIQTDATVAGCSTATQLRYSCALCPSIGAWLTVPNVMGPDGISFYGSAAVTDLDILKGAVTCCLSGALTALHGVTRTNADAVPVVPFTTNSSTVHRSVLQFGASASGMAFLFKEYTQQGAELASYPAVPGVNVVPMSAGSGF